VNINFFRDFENIIGEGYIEIERKKACPFSGTGNP
jgi:hypothetical protein